MVVEVEGGAVVIVEPVVVVVVGFVLVVLDGGWFVDVDVPPLVEEDTAVDEVVVPPAQVATNVAAPMAATPITAARRR